MRFFASFWADKAENLKILKESAEIEVPKLNYRFSIEKSGDIWKIELNEKVYELSDKDVGIKSLHLEISGIIEDGLRFEDLGYIEDTINDFIIVGIWEELPENAEEDFVLKLERILSDMGVFPKEVVFTDFLSKPIPVSRIISDSLSLTIYQPLLALFKTTVLFPLNLTEIKYKRIIPREEPLSERGENVLDILALMQLKNNKLPERLEYAVETYFNGRVYFKDMNFYLYDTNKRVEFSREHLPDGFMKTIVILTAIEQNPNVLLIDEIENSLHPELIEFLIVMLKEEHNGYTFLSTHSPVVLNLVEPEEVWIFRPTDEGVEIKNVTEYKSKEELLKELEELGITLGEKVLYGFT